MVNTDLLDELNAMVARDDEVRARLIREGRLFDGYNDDMARVHIDNAQRLDALVAEHGWPTVQFVGLEGARAAWRIAQNANCTPGLQRGFLRVMTEAQSGVTFRGARSPS